MKELLSLVNLLSIQKIKQIDIITEGDAALTKSGKLLQAIRNEKVTTDEDAMKLLYPNVKNPEVSFSKLKYRLKQRLINTAFFIDIQQYSKSSYEKAFFRATKTWAAGEIIRKRGLSKIGRDLIESQLKTCLKYDLTDLSLLILQSQKYRYGLFDFDQKKFKKYQSLYKVIKEKYDLRIINEDIYVQLANKLTHAKTLIYDDEVKSLEKELQQVLPQVEITDEYYTRFYAYNSVYFICMFTQDFKRQSEICQRALKYFATKNGFPNQGLFSFNQKIGLAYLSMKRFDKALNYFKVCKTYKPKEGGVSWQFTHSYIYLTSILQKNYTIAYETTSLVLNHKAFKKLSKEFQQPWHLKEAFVHFLIRIEKIDPQQSKVKPLRKFRLGRFLNEVTDISRDKKGVNITINILQLLFLILDKKYDLVLDKINALKQYSFRHLKGDKHVRARTFIRMLQKIPAGDYHPRDITKRTLKDFKKLQENPMLYTEDQIQLEIIPYEQMWEETIGCIL